MRKVAILKHKIIRAYHNPDNWDYSEFKGYPKGTYFGYDSLDKQLEQPLNDLSNTTAKA